MTIVIAFVSLVLLAIVGASLPAVRSPLDSEPSASSDPPPLSPDGLGDSGGEGLDLLSLHSVFLVGLGLVALLTWV